MSRVLAIARLNLVSLFRDRGELVGVIVLPLLLTYVFGTAFGSQGAERALVVPVADLDGSRYAEIVVAALDDSEGFDARVVDEEEARRGVDDGDVPVAIVIPAGFGADIEAGRPAAVEAVRLPGARNGAAAVEVVEGAVVRVAANAEAAHAIGEALAPGRSPGFAALYDIADGFWGPEPPVGVKASVVSATREHEAQMEAPSNTQYSLGFTVFFVFMTALGSAGGVLEEREIGTLRRMLAAPLRRAEILGGKITGVAVVAAFQATILVALGAIVFRVPWGSDPAAVLVLLASLVLAATGLGVMVSALVRTRGQMSALGPVLSTALAMLGGCYWPVEITTPLMQRIAMLTPTGWAMAGLKDVVARGGGIEAALVPSLLLVGFAGATLVIGAWRLRLE